MIDDTTNAKQQPEQNATLVQLRQLARDKLASIEADNLRLKDERNARRWKAERDPKEYEAQKAAQREAYRNKISHEKGREVRAYNSVGGKTHDEHDANARKRDAERKKALRNNASQDEKDQEADRVWTRRQVKAGKIPAQIEAGLAKRLIDRQDRPTPYSENPNFGLY